MIRYLSRTEVAAHIGVSDGTLGKYKLPKPDAYIGAVRGWKPATIQAWQDSRPGKGWRKGKGATP